MTRRGRAARPRTKEQLPPPLPPETRTVGQLVAETVRFYRHRFFRVVPLGLSVAVLTQVSVGYGRGERVHTLDAPGLDSSDRILLVRALNAREIVDRPDPLLGSGILVTMLFGGLLLTLSYVVACTLVSGQRLDMNRATTAYTAGVLAFLPVPILISFFVLPAVAWLAFVGLVVPVAVIEGKRLGDSFARATRLARADYVHALGGLATLIIAYFLTRLMLFFLLRNAGEATERAAAFLADLVLSPILFVGAAFLYYDQAARAAARAKKPVSGT